MWFTGSLQFKSGILFTMYSTKKKHTSYTMQFKLYVINFAKENSNQAAEVQFSVSEKLVRDWCKSKASLEELPKTKKSMAGKSSKVSRNGKKLFD